MSGIGRGRGKREGGEGRGGRGRLTLFDENLTSQTMYREHRIKYVTVCVCVCVRGV